MDAPQIQYARTADEVNIAYWTLGAGLPLVYMPNHPFNHIQLEWDMPESNDWFQSLAKSFRLIRYDGRGTGLSDRDATDYSPDTWIRDLEAVVDRVALDRFALLGHLHTGWAAIRYAAENPKRVSGLILWHGWASGRDFFDSPHNKAFRSARLADWELYCQSVAGMSVGWGAGELIQRVARILAESTTPELVVKVLRATRQADVSDLLSRIQAPTIIFHRRHNRILDIHHSRGLAARIPNARLIVLDGESVLPFPGNTDAVLRAIEEHVRPIAEPSQTPAPGLTAALHTILFTDVEESTMLTDILGDARAREVMRTHERITRDALAAHGGAEVKSMGDGFMASFASATAALDCAIEMQRAFAHYNAKAETPIRVRAGINAGEPIAEDHDLFGTAVIVAARVAAKAQGGEILATDVVRQLVAGKDFLFADRGDEPLRGFEDPVKLWQLRWQDDA